MQPNGQYNTEVYSEMFWGDFRGLLHAVGDRVPYESFDIEESAPGVFIPFPKWSDPVLETEFLNPYPDDEAEFKGTGGIQPLRLRPRTDAARTGRR